MPSSKVQKFCLFSSKAESSNLPNTMECHFLKTKKVPLSTRCWKWILEFMQFLFQISHPTSSSPPPPSQLSPRPPVELCNDILFDIFLRLPPQALPRFSCLNKQSSHMISSPLFQTRYWNQKLHLPRLSAIVYYQQKLNHRIAFALTIKEYGQRLDKSEFHKYRQVPEFRFPSSSYTRLLQWAESMLEFHEMGADGEKIQKQISRSHKDSN